LGASDCLLGDGERLALLLFAGPPLLPLILSFGFPIVRGAEGVENDDESLGPSCVGLRPYWDAAAMAYEGINKDARIR
jgi:hypothetical protein